MTKAQTNLVHTVEQATMEEPSAYKLTWIPTGGEGELCAQTYSSEALPMVIELWSECLKEKIPCRVQSYMGGMWHTVGMYQWDDGKRSNLKSIWTWATGVFLSGVTDDLRALITETTVKNR